MTAGKVRGIILAGGKGSRFRPDKLLLPVGGIPIVERAVRAVREVTTTVTLVANDPESFRFLGIPIIPDEEPDQGPLMGICSGLMVAPEGWALVAAGDMPFVRRELLRLLVETARSSRAPAVIPEVDGKLQPLLACYSTRLLPAIREALDRGEGSVRKVLGRQALRLGREMWKLADPNGVSFLSVNTSNDYEEAERLARERS